MATTRKRPSTAMATKNTDPGPKLDASLVIVEGLISNIRTNPLLAYQWDAQNEIDKVDGYCEDTNTYVSYLHDLVATNKKALEELLLLIANKMTEEVVKLKRFKFEKKLNQETLMVLKNATVLSSFKGLVGRINDAILKLDAAAAKLHKVNAQAEGMKRIKDLWDKNKDLMKKIKELHQLKLAEDEAAKHQAEMERQRVEDEIQRKKEAKQKEEAERQRQKEEEKERQEEEKRRQEEEKRRQEEEKRRLEEEKRREEEEERKKEEEKRRQERERIRRQKELQEEEKRRQEEEKRRQEEEKRRQEEEKRREEEEKRKKEEEKRRQERERIRRQKELQEKKRKERELAEQKRREEEEELKRIEAERKKREQEDKAKRQREQREREKAAKEKREAEERDRKERERLERERKEREERERLEQEEREREEKERLEREEREREEQERKRREAERLKREEEERKRKRAEELRKKREAEALRKKKEEERRREEEAEARRRNPANWRQLTYNAMKETKQNMGLSCVFRAYTETLVKSDLKVGEAILTKNIVPLGTGEDVATPIIDITAECGKLSFRYPPVLAMPNLGGKSNFSITIAKIRVDDEYEWRTVPARDTKINKYKDLVECELPEFSHLRIAFFKVVRPDSFSIKPKGGTVVSSPEPKISITFPDDKTRKAMEVIIKVRPVDHRTIESLKRHSSSCENAKAASHMLFVENLPRFVEPITVTMPALEHLRKGEKRGTKAPAMFPMPVQLGVDGQWSICKTADTELNEQGIVTITRSNPFSGMVVMGMATEKESEAEFAAGRLNQHLDEHVVRFVQRQLKKEPREVVTDCVPTHDASSMLKEWEEQGFTEGQVLPTGEVLIREGQSFTMSLNKGGNVRRTGFGKDPENGAIKFLFFSKLKCAFNEFSVEPNDIYGQRGRDFYFGHNEIFTENKTGKPEKVKEIEIRLPKLARERSIVQRAPMLFNDSVLDEAVFKSIAKQLDEDDWSDLASKLKIDKATRQRIGSDLGDAPFEDKVFAAMWHWFKTKKTVDDKVETLASALKWCGKKDLALNIEKLQQEKNEKKEKEARDQDLSKAFRTIVQSDNAIRNWMFLGRRLGVPDDEITAIKIDESQVKEKCYRVLGEWKEQKGKDATLESLSGTLKEMELNAVAEHLERAYVRPETGKEGKKQNASSRPSTSRR